jgi:DNA topoisomerase-1
MSKLVIVESPAKAKTIEKYLGKDYTVRASIGHIRDLPKTNKDAVDIEHGFTPRYEIPATKKKVVAELKKIAEKSDEVILATDLDREGEAIAWHLKEALHLKNPKRITFNEITEPAIKEAIQQPRQIDMQLKEAQEARRVLDRLFGYELSGLIWKKVRYGLSAGRVQSPALRILMEREREIRAFIPEQYFVLSGLFKKEKDSFNLVCDKEIWDKNEAKEIEETANKESWKIVSVKESEGKRNTRPPFTTSTLQQSASTRLGFSPSRTMGIAQKLYEKGFITYMRTDSRNLSKDAQAKMLSYVEKNFGKEYAKAQVYGKTSKNAQEAHEAIRPTDPMKASAGTTEEEKRLYRLIWERAIASQMTEARIMKTKVSANVSSKSIPNFSMNGSRLLFPGWLAVDTGARGEDVELPLLKEGDSINTLEIRNEAKETTAPNRYTEAGLIKELEKREIGRPSTYASTIKTLIDREYVTKEGKTLRPTDTGDLVSSFVEDNFKDYISDTFTATMEQALDDIAFGKNTYLKTLSNFYTIFKNAVDAKENIPKLTNLGPAPKEFTCPKCGKGMVYKLGRTGKFMSCETYPDCVGARTFDGNIIDEETPKWTNDKTGEPIFVLDGPYGPYVQMGKNPPKVEKGMTKEQKAEIKALPKPRRASLLAGMTIGTLTKEEALKLLTLPRVLGQDPKTEEDVIANIGRFGPYVGVGREFRSIKKTSGLDPYTISLSEALKLLSEAKALPKGTELAKNLGKHPKTGKEIQLLKSKSGYFLKKGLKRIFLPDNTNIEKFSIDDAVELLK